jgi:hypothetical protein
MKKIILFGLAAMLAFTMSATAQSRVTLRISRNYEVTIDGHRYTGNNTVSNLGYGYHQVEVYSTSGSFIFKRRTLVGSSSFDLRNGDATIDVDQNGQLRIYQNNSYSRNGNYNKGYGDRNYDGRGNRGNGNGYGPYNNPGRGHKYGLYKNQNKKNRNQDRDDNERNDD